MSTTPEERIAKSFIDKIINVDLQALLAEVMLFLAGFYEIPILATAPNGQVIAPIGFVAQVAAMAAVAGAYFRFKTTAVEVEARPK